MPTTSSSIIVLLGVALSAATVIDLRTGRIPNVLTASLAAAGVGLSVLGWSGLSVTGALLGLTIGLLLMLPGHLLGATGGGDVKLMAAIGACIGPVAVFSAFLGTALAGGVLAVAVAIRRGQLQSTMQGSKHLMTAPTTAKTVIEAPGRANRFAYGPAIAVGTLVAILTR